MQSVKDWLIDLGLAFPPIGKAPLFLAQGY
jgi:hypothetical protein